MITHPEKVLFPEDGITKGEFAAYYETVAPVMVPHLRARPITMARFPAGIDKKGFIQKDVSKGFPAWLQRVEVAKKDGTVHYPLVTDTRSLLWVVNQNTIAPHVWISRVPRLNNPDMCVFDLDPTEDETPACRRGGPLGRSAHARPVVDAADRAAQEAVGESEAKSCAWRRVSESETSRAAAPRCARHASVTRT